MKKKGFTLIELLAVIVVLAIIALIAVPMVLNTIDKAREGAAESSAYSYLEEVDKQIMLGKMQNGNGIIIPEDKELTMGEDSDDEELDKVKVKGTTPGFVTISFENDQVKSAGFCISGYNIDYTNGTVGESKTDYCRFATVNSITSSVTELTVIKGETGKLNIAVDPSDIIPQYTSSDENIATISSDGTITGINVGNAVITAKAGIKRVKVNVNIQKDNKSILGYVAKTSFENDSIVTTTQNGETYSAHVYTFDGNQVWAENKTFGNDSDVATASEEAKNMVIVKVNGDLTINSGVTVEPYHTIYGGPKGFLLYVTGTLTNNGVIDNSHGAKATGQNVYLWQNEDESYEFIPATGGVGGASSSATAGKKGIDGLNRTTGGGGSGASFISNPSGAGGNGTSYSGGTGGAGSDRSSTQVLSGSNNGGIGGKSFTQSSRSAGGGAGNPGGSGHEQGQLSHYGSNGTGGLIIVYADFLNNNGIIEANGSLGGFGVNAAGGSSGGGSINLFYKSTAILGTVIANGGTIPSGAAQGGAGGNGTITVGSVATDSFVAN